MGSGPPYFSAKDGLGSLTSKKKVCAPQPELVAWAKKRGVTVKLCEHCQRDGLLGNNDTESVATGHFSNYWIIKARPERNDFTRFPLRGKLGRWYTARPPKTWLAGDTLFIWAGSPKLRVIGWAHLVKPEAGFEDNAYYFGIEYDSNLIEGPTINDLRRDPLLRTASFLKSGPSGTVFPLTAGQGARMLQLLAPFGQGPPGFLSIPLKKAEQSEIRRRIGAGFGTAEDNRQIERAALSAATKHYKREGWQVQSVEADKCGFDLLCRKGRQECHIEVKGISGGGFGFILTYGEYQRAASDNKYELCVVQYALSNPTIQTVVGGRIFQTFQFVPLAFKAEARRG
ncbi:MAG: DUF3883 domain-containing protein [Bryobacterales bacterium]|nr:DUF3883 domain-containing protein [Bryobacterales bacterium]